MHLTVLLIHWRPYEGEGQGEKERQPVQTYKGHGCRHWPNEELFPIAIHLDEGVMHSITHYNRAFKISLNHVKVLHYRCTRGAGNQCSGCMQPFNWFQETYRVALKSSKSLLSFMKLEKQL